MRAIAFGAMFLCSVSVAALAAQPIVYPAPPAGFDPLTAGDEANRAYGFPTMPASNDPNFQQWVNVVTAPVKRASPNFQDNFHGMKVAHSPMKLPPGTKLTNPSVGSYNWAGYATSRQFTPGVQLYSSWLVPAVNLPSIGCQGGLGAFQSNWKGADGLTNGDVEQGGTLSGVDCSGNQYQPAAWYEDAPAPAIFYANVNPNDYVHQTLTITNTDMSVYFIDYSSFTAYAFDVPLSPAAPLTSVESIAEAPDINGSIAVFGPSQQLFWQSYNDYTRNPMTYPTSPTEYDVSMVSPYTNNTIATSTVTTIGLTVSEPAY